MNLKVRLNKSIKYLTGLKYQELIKAFVYSDIHCKQQMREVEVTLAASLALHSVLLNQNESSTKWIKHTTQNLTQEFQNYSVNHWSRNSQSQTTHPIPDDIDVTAFAIAALSQAKIQIDPKVFLKIIKLESKPGGPYLTWYLDGNNKFKNEIDPIVNANLLYAVGTLGIKLPNTLKYLKDKIATNQFSSEYYPFDIIGLFYLVRFAAQAGDKELTKLLSDGIKHLVTSKMADIEILFLLLIQANLGLKVNQNLLNCLIKLQNPDGSLPVLPFCYDFVEDKTHTYLGSKVISTALFVELITLLEKKQEKPKKLTDSNVTKLDNIIQKTLTKFPLEDWLKEYFKTKELYNILQIPLNVLYSIKPEFSEKDLEVINELTLATFYAWSGYTIQDDILDGQLETKYIPISNQLIREGWKYYYKLIIKYPEFEKIIIQAFNKCDFEYLELQKHRENFREFHKHLKSYEYITNRLQPYLATMKFLPLMIGLDKKTGQLIYKFFSSQLLIHQLNDDAHDWKEDLESKNPTFVLGNILIKSDATVSYSKAFWDKVMIIIIEICEKENSKAQAAIKQLKLKNPTFFQQLLAKVMNPVNHAKKERLNVQKMLKDLETTKL